MIIEIRTTKKKVLLDIKGFGDASNDELCRAISQLEATKKFLLEKLAYDFEMIEE